LELSAFELGALSGKIKSELRNWYVNNIYSVGSESLLLRFHRSESGDRSLIIAPKLGTWVTKLAFPRTNPTDFVKEARSFILRKQLTDCSVVPGERITRFIFGSSSDYTLCFVEFFGAGNIVVTDTAMNILSILKQLDVRERRLKKGLKYILPPPRGAPVEEMKPGDLMKSALSGTQLSKLLGKITPLPERFTKEALHRIRIDPDSDAGSLDFDVATRLVREFTDMKDQAYNSERFFLYKVGEREIISSLPLLHLQVPPIADSDPFTFADEVLGKKLIELAQRELSPQLDEKISKEQRRIEAARLRLEQTKRRAEELSGIATALISGGMREAEAAEKIASLSSTIQHKDGAWMHMGRSMNSPSVQSVASKLFDESKKLLNSTNQILDSISKMEKNLKRMREQEFPSFPTQNRPTFGQTSQRRWFQSYRWFFTSEKLLAVGGRDAGSNSLLVRRKMEETDLVFHTEDPGSPFFLLKGGRGAGGQSIDETAIGTVSFSRAWREGLSSADAFFVSPDQVKLGAPSGMYLARGAFMVEGQRTYVKGVRLRLCVGVTLLDGRPVACSGPKTSLLKYCPLMVEIEPGHFPVSDAAKKVRSLFVNHSEELRPVPDIDEIVRVMPPGKSSVKGLIRGEGRTPPVE
jgi:predicted ribosome quality control (RQC) complex YloA/Tae2 family protein